MQLYNYGNGSEGIIIEEGGNITLDFYKADEVVEYIRDCTRDVIFTN